MPEVPGPGLFELDAKVPAERAQRHGEPRASWTRYTGARKACGVCVTLVHAGGGGPIRPARRRRSVLLPSGADVAFLCDPHAGPMHAADRAAGVAAGTRRAL